MVKMKWSTMIVLLVVSLLMLIVSSRADSLFPSLETAAPEAAEAAPSYGEYAGVAPASAEPYAEGGTVVTYADVSEEEYQNFGESLGQQGFELADSHVDGRTAEMIVANGKYRIGVVYNADSRELKLIYEDGVAYARMDPFKGCTREDLGKVILVRGLGEFSATEFHLNNYQVKRATEIFYGSPIGKAKSTSTVLIFRYLNTTNETKNYKSDSFLYKGEYLEGTPGKKNDLADITLYYINDTGTYKFKSTYYGILTSDKWLLCDDDDDTGIRQLQSSLRCASFDLPQSVKDSTDGTLAVVLEFAGTDEKAVIILRENGVKRGDWE